MSREEFETGLGIIEASAKKYELRLGSKHLDWFRGSVTLSLERDISVAGRQLLRAPTVELSTEFVEDLPSQKEYQTALANYLHSLSLRLNHPNPLQFLTLSAVPLSIEIHWPFRQVQESDSSFVHVLVRLGSPWAREANFTVLVWGPDRLRMGVPSLNPPTAEPFVVNSIRLAVDRNQAKFYNIGGHPPTLQQIEISPSFGDRPAPGHREIQEFIKRKVYWLGFREGDDRTVVSVVDPYDCSYLGWSAQRLRQIARVLSANQEIELDRAGEYATCTSKLLLEANIYENELNAFLGGTEQQNVPVREQRRKRASSTRPSVFVSYSSDDTPFATFLANSLRNRNIGIWLDRWEIRIGDSLVKRIGEALRANDFIVVVLSPSSVRSEWVQKELAEAMTREIREKRIVVLPVIARRCDVPAFLADKKYADFTRDSDSAFEALVDSIKRHHGSSEA